MNCPLTNSICCCSNCNQHFCAAKGNTHPRSDEESQDMEVDRDISVIKVILPARQIPMGSTVTKRTGSYTFTLVDEIKVYPIPDKTKKGEPMVPQSIKASDGALFLLGSRGAANAIGADTELVWITDVDILLDFLTYETPQ